MKRLLLPTTLLTIAALACALPGQPQPTATSLAPTMLPTDTPAENGSGASCGDGVCDAFEDSSGRCPADCGAATEESPPQPTTSPVSAATAEESPPQPTASLPSPPGASEQETLTVINPTSGARLHVQVLRPPGWSGAALPTLGLVPGGNGSSVDFMRPPRNAAPNLAAAGFTVVIFDPDGRGKSEGVEDQNGFVQQDGLAEVVRTAAGLPGVDPDQIGVVSFSFGVTMATGALVRHPDLPVGFLMDWEGPVNRDDTGGCDADHLGHLFGIVACDDEAFWAQREALTFASDLRVNYQRLQSERDHVQPDNAHAIAIVNAAVTGGAPWVRLNDLTPNQTYDPAAPPPMLPDSVDGRLSELVATYAVELFALP